MKKRIAIHRHITGCKIFEYHTEVPGQTHKTTFTARIFGWNNFHFCTTTGLNQQQLFTEVSKQVTEIRNMLRDKDNSQQLEIVETLPQMYSY